MSDNKIDELRDSLYSRNNPPKRTRVFTPKTDAYSDSDTKNDWQDSPKEDVYKEPIYNKLPMPFFSKLLIGSFIFFVVALLIGFFIVFRGNSVISNSKVDILITGPVSVSGGQEFAFDVKVYNKNNVALEFVDLSVEFPSGSVDPLDTSKEYKRFRELLPDISPGGFSSKTISTVLYGEEQSKKEIAIKAEYRLKGSSAIYAKEKIYEVAINAAPVMISIEGVKETTSRQPLDLTVTISSNSTENLKNILLKAVYPFGFKFIEANPKPLSDNITWFIGDLKPQDKKVIKLKGYIEGEDGDERVFRFVVGNRSAKSDRQIGTEFVSNSYDLIVKKPFLGTSISLEGNNNQSNFPAKFEDPINAEILWVNNTPDELINANIVLKFSGSAFDKFGVIPEDGVFKSSQNEITWNQLTNRELAKIAPGDSGRVSFRFTPKDGVSGNGSITLNPEVNMSVSVSAYRGGNNNVSDSIKDTSYRKVVIVSTPTISGQVLRSVGPFENMGPIPPKAENKTTYTIVLTVYNTSNELINGEIRTSLPPYIKWLDRISPSGEDVVYNKNDGSIVWNVGRVKAYGTTDNKREVAFHVELEPSVNQIGQSLILLGDSYLKAEDSFTKTTLEDQYGPITTRFSNDPTFKEGYDVVTR